MPSGAQIIFPESGRGLGHVTPTIFGSTVGYPSDSLASCSTVPVYTVGFTVLFSTAIPQLPRFFGTVLSDVDTQ